MYSNLHQKLLNNIAYFIYIILFFVFMIVVANLLQSFIFDSFIFYIYIHPLV